MIKMKSSISFELITAHNGGFCGNVVLENNGAEPQHEIHVFQDYEDFANQIAKRLSEIAKNLEAFRGQPCMKITVISEVIARP